MSLLDAVVAWDAEVIHCRAAGRAGQVNPLAEGGLLHPAALLEYGAQAAAVHAARSRDGAPGSAWGPGARVYLAALRDLELTGGALPAEGPLEVFARCLARSGDGASYEVRVEAAGSRRLAARISLLVAAPAEGGGA
jgi:predicted hotdog family 3-hydroxylacyl-ACP dehydratase